MKKAIALILAVLCVLATVCGCSNNKSNTEPGGNTSNPGSSQTDSNKSTDAGYKTFDDLPRQERMGDLDIYLNTADYRTESFGYGFSTSDSLDYAIVTSSAQEPITNVTVDDVFSTTYNEDFHSILLQFNRADYDDYTPDIIDRVTLTCEAEAIKFEGKQPVNEYGTKSEYYVYGYSFVFNDVPLIISCVAKDSVDEAKKAEFKGYVDEMIHTVRTQP